VDTRTPHIERVLSSAIQGNSSSGRYKQVHPASRPMRIEYPRCADDGPGGGPYYEYWIGRIGRYSIAGDAAILESRKEVQVVFRFVPALL
jgi:hypothetical protein